MSSVTDVDELLLSKDRYDQNLLHLAAESSSAELMRDLLNLLPLCIVKQLLVMRDIYGRTPLHSAARYYRDNKILLMLVDFVLDPSKTFG